MIEYAKKFIGVEYEWAGNSADEGFDCSGFVCEVLKSQDYIKNKEDLNSQQLYNRFVKDAYKTVKYVQEGDLLFFGKDNKSITHIALAISYTQCIEAGGEGRVSTKNGMVRIRPINYRKDLVAIIRL